MTTRFFGEFLVKKNVISSSALVSALLEQMDSLPSVGKLVSENNWMSPDDILQVFHAQQEKGMDFISASQSLSLWNDELFRNVENELSKRRTPIGQILVRKGEIDIKNLTKLLDDFLAQAVKPSESEALVRSEETDLEEENYQPGIIAELEDMFDERKRKAVKVALGFIKDKNPPDAAVMTKLLQDSLKIVRTILGLVKIFGLTQLQNLLQEIERILEAKMVASSFSVEELQQVAECLSEALEESWKLRESIVQHCTDRMYFKDIHAKKRYDDMLATLKAIQ